MLVTELFSTVKVGGNPLATFADSVPFVHIPPFGTCSVTGAPCVPRIVSQWTASVATVTAANERALPVYAHLECTIGGDISVTDCAQSTVVIGGPPRPPHKPGIPVHPPGGPGGGRQIQQQREGNIPRVRVQRPGGGGKCWVAAALYGEGSQEFELARIWIFEGWRGWQADVVRHLYLRFGPAVALQVRRWPILRRLVKPWFDRAVERGRSFVLDQK